MKKYIITAAIGLFISSGIAYASVSSYFAQSMQNVPPIVSLQGPQLTKGISQSQTEATSPILIGWTLPVKSNPVQYVYQYMNNNGQVCDLTVTYQPTIDRTLGAFYSESTSSISCLVN